MAVCGALALAPGPTRAAERLCGWLHNPTPANYWLTDRATQWTLSEQGGSAVPGFDDLPDMARYGWVVTNGDSYGYGCACLLADVDRRAGRVIRVIKAEPVPLRKCRNDRRLPQPG